MGTTWQDRLAAAVKAGRGVRLSAEEALDLYQFLDNVGQLIFEGGLAEPVDPSAAVEPYDVEPWSTHQKPDPVAFAALGGTTDEKGWVHIPGFGYRVSPHSYQPAQLRLWQLLGGDGQGMTQDEVMAVLRERDPRFAAYIQGSGLLGLYAAPGNAPSGQTTEVQHDAG